VTEETSVLVFGIGELASAVARKLHLAGHAVAIHQPSPPTTIRRRMAFADAWSDGACTFEGVEARRADKTKDFLAGLRSGTYIPVLWHPFDDVTTRWPWDVLVDARPKTDKPRQKLVDLSDLTIGIGAGFVAGETCDIVIDSGGRDPGAVLRAGAAPDHGPKDAPFADGALVHAPVHGLFHGSKLLGEPIEAGQILGFIGTTAVTASASGRLRGLARDGAAVAKGAEVAEIVSASPKAVFVGITQRDRMIARSVAFVIEMERAGYTPISFENFI
jgi:xanthine dehydrogenase accessory factor